MTIDHRPKATDNPDPGPIANAREHLPLIRRECMPATVTAVERLIEYAERLIEYAERLEPRSSMHEDSIARARGWVREPETVCVYEGWKRDGQAINYEGDGWIFYALTWETGKGCGSLLEALDMADKAREDDCPTDDAVEPDWTAIQEEASPARGDLYFATRLLRAYHEAVHAKPPADPYEGWTASYDSDGLPWRWSHFSTASIQIDRLGRYGWFPADTNFCDPDDFTDTFAEAARLALGGVK